jgi:hypothetical protein
MILICRDHAVNVTRWRDGQMALRWCAAGMIKAGNQFRRVNGHLHLRSLRDTLNRVTEPAGSTRHDDAVDSLSITRAATEVPQDSGHPPVGGGGTDVSRCASARQQPLSTL